MNFILGFGLSSLGFLNGYNKTDIKILEKNNYNGGHVYSHKFRDFYFDEGVHVLHSKNKKFLKFILKNSKYINKSSNPINYYNGNWFKYPVQNNLSMVDNGLKYLISFLVRSKNFKPKNFLEWCLSVYGEEITNKFYKRYTQKYWNKNLAELDTSWLPGRVFSTNDEQVIKNCFFNNKDSVSTFDKFKYPKTNGYFGFFKNHFDKYKKITTNNVRIESINLKEKIISYNKKKEKFDKIFSTIPLPELKKYISFPKQIKTCIDKLEFTSLYTVNIIIKKKFYNFRQDWNYVYDNKTRISRMSILNNIQGSKSKYLAVQIEIFTLGNSTAKVNVKKEIAYLSKILKINKKDIIDHSVRFIKYSYVISKNNNLSNVIKIKNFLNKFNFYPFGLYGDWIYYWSDQAFIKGFDFGKKFK